MHGAVVADLGAVSRNDRVVGEHLAKLTMKLSKRRAVYFTSLQQEPSHSGGAAGARLLYALRPGSERAEQFRRDGVGPAEDWSAGVRVFLQLLLVDINSHQVT